MLHLEKPRFRVLLAAAALAVITAVGGCSTDAAGGAADVPAAAQGVSDVGVEQFQSVVESGATVIDVRTPAEFAAGHLHEAVNIDINAPGFAEQVATLDPGATYAVYCRSGNRSATAAGYMEQAGFTSVYNLDAGIIDWQSAGLPVV